MLKKIKNELIENKKYIFLGYVISILTMLPQFVDFVTLKHFIYLFILLIILFLTSKFNKLLFAIFIIYINVINIISWNIEMHWGSYTCIGARCEVAILSPSYETIEYLKTYIDYRDVLLIIYSLFILGLLYKFLVHFRHSFKILKFLSILIATSMVGILAYIMPNPWTRPFDIPIEYEKAKHRLEVCDKRMKYLRSLSDNQIKNNAIYDKIVFIQGEAVNKHHMAIYGYDRNTTPFFSSLKDKNKIYIFNAISPANQTRYSVPMMHSPANVHNFWKLFIHSRADVGYFKRYGYKTYWISNQAKAGKHDSAIACMAKEANVTYFENIHYSTAKPDEILLPYIFNIKNHSDKEFYVIHLIGSHFEYTERYDEKHALFKNATTLKDKYDNTIYNTDYVLKQIFTYFLHKFPNKKILFVYASDHGEVVSENKHGHGFLPPFRDEYEIPFVIYSTIKNSRIDELYNENKKGYFNLENLNYIVKYISGISNENNISYSNYIFSLEPNYIFDYNKLKFYNENKR